MLSKPSTFALLEYRAGVLTARPAGPYLGEREAMIISREIHDAFDILGRKLRTFVLDLETVQTVSGMGLGMCIDAHKTARSLRARTVVCGLHRQIEELFRVMKVDRMYKIARNEAELGSMIAA